MSYAEDTVHLRQQLDRVLARGRECANVLVGTLVDRHTVKVRGCGAHTADTILTCLAAIRRTSLASPLFARMGKAIRRDGTVDLWIQHPEERWRAAAFAIQFHPAFRPEDLMLTLATYIPFGVEGDRSVYPVEQSTAYRRDTQEV